MARLKPPQHRADIPGHYIPRSDSSFDRDRYDREINSMKEGELDVNQHPIERYYSGETRYDLQAVESFMGGTCCAGDYFKIGNEPPERFFLRRLDWAQWHSVLHLVEAGNFSQAQLLACRYGVAGVENSTIKLPSAASGMLSHEDMQRLFDADPTLPSSLGFAAWRYSRPLMESEKKA